jgi:multisubunit Na+/H+ antiporter MnhB subunit
VEREEETMNRLQTAAPPVPGLGVGMIMARRDRPYPGKAVNPLATIALVVVVVLIGAFALLQHQAADVAFQAYALKTSFVGVSSLASHPERYRGQLVHTRGETGDVVLTDSGRQVIVSLPAAAEGTGGAGTQILMLTGADVPPHSLVDIWGTCAGTMSLAGGARQGSITVVRAAYVESAR